MIGAVRARYVCTAADTWEFKFNGAKSKREERREGSLRSSGRAVQLVFCFACLSICLFFGEVVGTEGGGRDACLLSQPRSKGLGSVRSSYDDMTYIHGFVDLLSLIARLDGDGSCFLDGALGMKVVTVTWEEILVCGNRLIDRLMYMCLVRFLRQIHVSRGKEG